MRVSTLKNFVRHLFCPLLGGLLLWALSIDAWADSSSPSVFAVSPNDKSVSYLGMIFGGNIGPLVLGGNMSNPILSNMFQKFNWIIVTVGSVILSYIGILGTINTAHEGEAMGKKWSSIWIPMKSIIGMLLMVPTPGTGYSLIQVSVMWVVLQGIGAANAVWSVVATQMASGFNVSGQIQVYPGGTPIGLTNLSYGLLYSATCMQTLNTMIPGPDIVAQSGLLTATPTAPYFTPADNNGNVSGAAGVSFGNASNPTACGSVTISANDVTSAQFKLNGVMDMLSQIQIAATDIALSTNATKVGNEAQGGYLGGGPKYLCQ